MQREPGALRAGDRSRESLAQFEAICERERCPFAVVGVATDERQLVVGDDGARPCDRVDMPMDVLLGKPPKMHRDVQAVRRELQAAST